MLFSNSWAESNLDNDFYSLCKLDRMKSQVIKNSFKNKTKKNTKDYNNKNENKSNNKINKINNSINDSKYYNDFRNFLETENFDSTNILMNKLNNGLIIK